MTNDELKALCESNARSIAALASEASEERQQRSTNTNEIDILLGAVSSNEVACRELRQAVTVVANAMAEGNQRFDTLRSEAISDRRDSDQRFDTLQREAISERRDSDQRFDTLRSEAISDRQDSDQRFDTLRNEAISDRRDSDQRFNAQQEVIQTLLAQLISASQDIAQTKNNISGLSDRVDNLEQAG